jgi:hypothetical protein
MTVLQRRSKGSSFFNEKDYKGLEHQLQDRAKRFDHVFGDEVKCYHMRWVSHTLTAVQRPNVGRWLDPCDKHRKIMQSPTSTSYGLVISRGCSMTAIAKQCGQHFGRKWTNGSG